MDKQTLIRLIEELNNSSEFEIKCIEEDLEYHGNQIFKYELKQIVKPRMYRKDKYIIEENGIEEGSIEMFLLKKQNEKKRWIK